jgi:hypothetical protein
MSANVYLSYAQRFDASVNENGLAPKELIQGAFERAISMFRTSYSIVAQARSSVDAFVAPRVWFCNYAPHASSYLPFYVNQHKLPAAYTHGSLFKYDPTSAFWNFLAVNNYASRFYKFAFVDVREVQENLQALSVQKAAEVEAFVGSLQDPSQAAAALDDFSEEQAKAVVSAWADLLPQLITKFHDGYRAEDLAEPTISMHKFFYPKWFLDASGFWNNKPNVGPDVIMFQPTPNSGVITHHTAFVVAGLSAGIAAVLGFAIGRRGQKLPMGSLSQYDYSSL